MALNRYVRRRVGRSVSPSEPCPWIRPRSTCPGALRRRARGGIARHAPASVRM